MNGTDIQLAYQWFSTGMTAHEIAAEMGVSIEEVFKAIEYMQDCRPFQLYPTVN